MHKPYRWTDQMVQPNLSIFILLAGTKDWDPPPSLSIPLSLLTCLPKAGREKTKQMKTRLLCSLAVLLWQESQLVLCLSGGACALCKSWRAQQRQCCLTWGATRQPWSLPMAASQGSRVWRLLTNFMWKCLTKTFWQRAGTFATKTQYFLSFKCGLFPQRQGLQLKGRPQRDAKASPWLAEANWTWQVGPRGPCGVAQAQGPCRSTQEAAAFCRLN